MGSIPVRVTKQKAQKWHNVISEFFYMQGSGLSLYTDKKQAHRTISVCLSVYLQDQNVNLNGS